MSDLHALLIGVDHYEPNRGPDRLRFDDLEGAVNDTMRIVRYLREGPLRVACRGIRTLISPGLFSRIEMPPPELLPTYGNIVREIQTLTDRVGEGDQVLIQFSGHGARVPSVPPITGRRRIDESIVPLDGADPDGGVLRDVEMYGLLSKLSATGAYVTVILDSCHSGSALRGSRRGRVRFRGLGLRTGFWGPRESAVGSWDELYGRMAEAERATWRPGFRQFAARSGWFPQPEGCVLLAACRGPELAREEDLGSVGVSGAFTHCLLEVLEERGEEISYANLQHLVSERVLASWKTQMPIFEGDGELGFLGAGRRPSRPSATSGRTEGEVSRYVDHRVRFAEIRDLATPPASPLAGSLSFDLFKLKREEDWHDPALRLPIEGNCARSGEIVCLLVRNGSDQVLNLVVLDVRPDWAIERVHPKKDQREFAVIEPGQEHPVSLKAWLPDDLSKAVSRLKVLATVDRIDAEAFELPVLGAGYGIPPQSRLPLPPDDRWMVEDVSVTVVR